MNRRGAIVGYGAIAQNGHMPRWRAMEGVEIVGVSDVRFAGGRTSVDGFPAYASVEAMLDDLRPDFLDVCTPPSSHAAIVAAALARGVHVFCEKPLVVDRSSFEAVETATTESDAVCFTVHNWRHAPILDDLAKRVSRIGDVREIEWTVERTEPSRVAGGGPNWRLDRKIAGGGILVDHGWHALYLILEWLGSVPEKVEATLERRRYLELDVEDTATAVLHAGDARARLFFTWAGADRRNEARLEGSKGRISMLDDSLEIEAGGEREALEYSTALSGGSSHPDWFDATARDFFAEVDGEVARGRNLRAARACYRVLDAAWRSNEAGGRAVEVGA